MSEKLFPSGEDDQGAGQPSSEDYLNFDLIEDPSGRIPNEGGESRPGDPSIEEMLRRARDSGMDDTPQPGEQGINIHFDQ